MYCDADDASEDTERRSVSGVAVSCGGAVASTTRSTQLRVTLPISEAEFIMMTERAEHGLFSEAV